MIKGDVYMVDLLEVVLVTITLFSALFVAITEGLKQTTGYRGSEETRRRKERIDKKLMEDFESEFSHAVESNEWRDIKERREVVQELGHHCFIAQNLTADLLDASERFVRSAIRNLIIATLLLFGTIYLITYFFNTEQTILAAVIYLLFPALFYYSMIQAIMKSANLRREFITLDENSNLESAVNLWGKLLDKKLL
jgi:hypothetical protein